MERFAPIGGFRSRVVSTFVSELVPVESLKIHRTYENTALQVPKEGPLRVIVHGRIRTKRGGFVRERCQVFLARLVLVESFKINKSYENKTFQVLQVPKEGPPRLLSLGSVRTKGGVSFERGVNFCVRTCPC